MPENKGNISGREAEASKREDKEKISKENVAEATVEGLQPGAQTEEESE